VLSSGTQSRVALDRRQCRARIARRIFQ
jgi:hypothetical protein